MLINSERRKGLAAGPRPVLATRTKTLTGDSPCESAMHMLHTTVHDWSRARREGLHVSECRYIPSRFCQSTDSMVPTLADFSNSASRTSDSTVILHGLSI
eukprot:5629811-Pyramimonas_sp.AAC.1